MSAYIWFPLLCVSLNVCGIAEGRRSLVIVSNTILIPGPDISATLLLLLHHKREDGAEETGVAIDRSRHVTPECSGAQIGSNAWSNVEGSADSFVEMKISAIVSTSPSVASALAHIKKLQ